MDLKTERIEVSLPFAISISAYNIQTLAVMRYRDSIIYSTKLGYIAAMRHYRASIIVANNKMRDICIEAAIYDLSRVDEIDAFEIFEIFLMNDESIENVFDYKHPKGEYRDYNKAKNDAITYGINKTLKSSYYDMINTTNQCVSSFFGMKIQNEKFLYQHICMQCGQVYENKEKIGDECSYCQAGINHIVSIYDVCE